MGRYGTADDLVSSTLYLCDDASAFVTGIVIPIDGGFSAYSGV
jgi:NAD(P)-dependent dehydrogenase (short-subunit alcohol dehydrogenase family)